MPDVLARFGWLVATVSVQPEKVIYVEPDEITAELAIYRNEANSVKGYVDAQPECRRRFSNVTPVGDRTRGTDAVAIGFTRLGREGIAQPRDSSSAGRSRPQVNGAFGI
jgi:hypothetical protein